MKYAAIFPVLLLVLSAGSAMAQDPRLVEHLYDPSAIVEIEGRAKTQATITFNHDEVIENVAIGDSQSWQVTPNKRANLLFVKPLAPNAETNMTVVTSKRTYLFDLKADPRNEPLYLIRFTYPEPVLNDDERQALAEVERASDLELAAAQDPYAVVDPAALNFAWSSRGDENLVPDQIYDDGRATFLNWPNGQAVPAILIKDAEGTEGPVNFTVRGDTIVVDGVPREIVLRSGEERAYLYNAGPERSEQAGLSTRATKLAEVE